MCVKFENLTRRVVGRFREVLLLVLTEALVLLLLLVLFIPELLPLLLLLAEARGKGGFTIAGGRECLLILIPEIIPLALSPEAILVALLKPLFAVLEAGSDIVSEIAFTDCSRRVGGVGDDRAGL
jgi:hypothetical protein